MKKLIYILFFVLVSLFSTISIYAKAGDDNKKVPSVIEANVWKTEDGVKHFTCPVMGEDGVVDSTTSFSEVDGKRYYHCCGGCAEKFQVNPNNYLENFFVPANVVKIDDSGNHFKCPVSGEIGIVSEKTPFSDLIGKRYYFCCAKCKNAFDTDSKKFVKENN